MLLYGGTGPEFSGFIHVCRIRQSDHVGRILTINTPLSLHQEPSTATMLSDVKYSIYHLNYGNVLSIIACRFYCVHFEM